MIGQNGRLIAAISLIDIWGLRARETPILAASFADIIFNSVAIVKSKMDKQLCQTRAATGYPLELSPM